MIASVFSPLLHSSIYSLNALRKRSPFKLISKSSPLSKSNQILVLKRGISSPTNLFPLSKRNIQFISFCNTKGNTEKNAPGEEGGLDWPIFERWDVPWEWQTVLLTMFASGASFVLTGFLEGAAAMYLGIERRTLSLDEKAEILFVDQVIVTAVILGVVFGITKSFRPLPDDVFCYEMKEPFNLQKGWLLWSGVGLVGALIAISLTGVAFSLFNGGNPEREKDALVILLPLIGSSSISTALLVGITGVLAPVLEETLFRGFLLVSLTKWVPTPVSVLITAAVFALAHLTPGEFPQLFVLGVALGFSYAQTRNLLTPIIIHSLWNSGVILILTFLQKARSTSFRVSALQFRLSLSRLEFFRFPTDKTLASESPSSGIPASAGGRFLPAYCYRRPCLRPCLRLAASRPPCLLPCRPCRPSAVPAHPPVPAHCRPAVPASCVRRPCRTSEWKTVVLLRSQKYSYYFTRSKRRLKTALQQV